MSVRLLHWLYLDMNSFFASVEQEVNPSLLGKPIAVVPLMADTTCCIAVSYEGNAFGVKTGTRVREAKKLCPGIRFIKGNHERYIQYHHRIVEAVESCLPVESVCSIDELACRLTGSQQDSQQVKILALQIKDKIKKEVGLSLRCSIGVAPNRYLAKIAADMKKPDGFTMIRKCDLPEILYFLKLRDLPGVGPRMEARLHQKGIYSVKKLCSLSSLELRQAWGSMSGEEMHALLMGHEIPEVKTSQKSISQSQVLPPTQRNEKDALRVLKKLTTRAAWRLRKEKFWASKLDIFVRFTQQDAWNVQCSFVETQDTLEFIHGVTALWRGLPSASIYQVGVILSGLVPDSLHTPSLFENPHRQNLIKTLDHVNLRFGKGTIQFGATHESD